MPPKGMTANPIKAPRYRPGKVVAEAESSDSDSSDSEVPISKPPPKPTAGGITSDLKKVNLDERRKAAALKEASRIEEEAALKIKEEEGFVTESEGESEEESGSDEESSEEEESEEEAPKRVMMRPMFIKKDKRNNSGAVKETRTEEEIAEAEEARRKAAADEIVEEQIRKDIAARAAGKKNWDDDEDDDEVDDTDGLDPEAEYAAWKLREMKRLKREREVIEEHEKELAEIERRRGLTEDERRTEDDKHIAQQKEEKESRGTMAYLQKYQHKGAFFQDETEELGLANRNLMGARFVDDVQNRELLPQALQIRDMTKLGKRGATKYKDLKSEDTGRWGQFDDRGPRKGTGDFGTDERFKPDDGRGASGANSMPVAERKKVNEPPQDAPQGPRDSSRSKYGTDEYRPNHSDRRSRSRSRSRSPRRDSYRDDRRRKRSNSRDRDRYDGDKRRRVDSR